LRTGVITNEHFAPSTAQGGLLSDKGIVLAFASSPDDNSRCEVGMWFVNDSK
jgi:hypothetical protein